MTFGDELDALARDTRAQLSSVTVRLTYQATPFGTITDHDKGTRNTGIGSYDEVAAIVQTERPSPVPLEAGRGRVVRKTLTVAAADLDNGTPDETTTVTIPASNGDTFRVVEGGVEWPNDGRDCRLTVEKRA